MHPDSLPPAATGDPARLEQVDVAPLALERFADVLDERGYERLTEVIERAQLVLRGRVVWNVNSTARGGGVAEMLQSLVGYARGGGVDARWMVIPGDAEFFRITKRLHNHLHGAPGDGGSLDSQARAGYERALADSAAQLVRLVRVDDIVVLHDPQTAGLLPALRETGARVVWRCHIGVDDSNDLVRSARRFLSAYLAHADAYVFSHAGHVWEELDPDRVTLIAPSIDAFSAKNQALSPAQVLGILGAARLLADGGERDSTFRRADGTPGRVDRHAELIQEAPLDAEARIVTQVSRFDRLKDPIGVLRGFVEHCPGAAAAHLVLAGPAVEAVSDDPEALEVWSELHTVWTRLAKPDRQRVHLAALPMDDLEENAAIVNALQRHSEIVVQKSLAEGFGLTVSEAMWKGRPVVASRVGGIEDQVLDGVTGLLLEDPTDLDEFGAALSELLADPASANALGIEAQRRVREHYLGPRHLGQYLDLFQALITAAGDQGSTPS
jgi:trehalose synthase